MKLINEFLEYLKVIKHYSEKTIISYEFDICELYNYFKSKKIDIINITRKDTEAYLEFLYSLKIDKNTISRKLSSIRSFYNYLVKEEKVSYNYFNLISNPKHKISLPNYLKDKDLDKMFEVPDLTTSLGQRNRLILELLYATGIRVSELVNIKINEINRYNRTIKVLGKGEKERIVVYGHMCENIMNMYIKDGRCQLLKNKNNDYLLLNKNGNNLSTRMIRNILDDIMIKSGIRKHVHPHMLRHTFATDMLNNGADIISVKELLGHENVNTTSIYTHVTNEQIKKVYESCHPRAKE